MRAPTAGLDEGWTRVETGDGEIEGGEAQRWWWWWWWESVWVRDECGNTQLENGDICARDKIADFS